MDFGSFLRRKNTPGTDIDAEQGKRMLGYNDVMAGPTPNANWMHNREDYYTRGRGFKRAQPNRGQFVRGVRSRGQHWQFRHNYQNSNDYYAMQSGSRMEFSEDPYRESGGGYSQDDYGDLNLNTNSSSRYSNYEDDFTQPVDQYNENKVQQAAQYRDNKAQYGDQYRDNEAQYGDQYRDNEGQWEHQDSNNDDQYGGCYGEKEDLYGHSEVQSVDQHEDTVGQYTMVTEKKLKNSEPCDDLQSSLSKYQPTTIENEAGDKAVQNVEEAECTEDLENSDEEKDETTKAIEKLPARHNRGLMSTLIGLAGPEIQNRPPDPLPPPQPMKLVDDNALYLNTNKPNLSKIDQNALLEYGITQKMIEEANIVVDDPPANERDLLPNEIGKELNKEFFCKLCQVQTTSMGNFRDHLNGKGHKSTYEAFKQGKKPSKKKKKTVAISSEVLGKKSVTMEMVEDVEDPILGLSYITEYHSQSGIINVCNLCGVKFDRNIVVSHVTGAKHRLHYMKENRPSVYVHLKKFGGKKSQLSAFLDELSLDAEREDGRGVPSIKVFEQPDNDNEDETITEMSLDEVEDDEKKQKVSLSAQRKQGNISFQDWVNEEIVKSKSKAAEKGNSCEEEDSSQFKFGTGSSAPPMNNASGFHQPQLLQPEIPMKQPQHGIIPPFDPLLHNFPRHPLSSTHFSHVDDHLPHRYGPEPFLPRNDHYFEPYRGDPLLYQNRPLLPPSSRSQPYLDKDPLRLSVGRGYHPRDPYFDPNPLKVDRNSEPFLDPNLANRVRNMEPYLDPDPTKRVRNSEPYLDPDPTKRVRNSEPYLDPDPTKRFRNSEPYLDPDPTKRVRNSEPYLDPDPLKRIPPKKTAPTPVVFDYGHGSGGKNDTTPHKSSVQKTADKWENDIQKILGTGANKAPNSLAILSSNYSSPESSPPPVTGKKPSMSDKPRISDKPLPFSRSYLDTHLPLNIPKATRPKKPEETLSQKSSLEPSSSDKSYSEKRLNDSKKSPSQDHDSSSRHKSQSRSPEHDQNHRSRLTDYAKGNIAKSSTAKSSGILAEEVDRKKYSVSPKKSSKRRHSISPDKSLTNKSRCPSPSYFSKTTDRTRISPISKNRQDSQSFVRTQTDTNKEIQDIFSEMDEEAQAEKIANLLLHMSGSLLEAGDAQSALQKLFANSDLTRALLAAKTKTNEQKDLGSQEKPDKPTQSHRQSRGNASQTHPPPRRERVTFSLPVTSRGHSVRSTLPSDFAADEDTD